MDSQRLQPGVGRAHGKVILLGEHTVVYGTPALALPVAALPVTACARTESAPAARSYAPTRNSGVHCRYRIGGRPASTGVEVAVAAALRQWALSDRCVDLDVWCAVPPGRGLGASAASAAAAVRAVADFYDKALDEACLYRLVQCGEQVSHGRASGVDAWASIAQGPIWFHADTVRPLEIGFDAELVIADTGIASSTKLAVESVRARLAADPALARRLMDTSAALIGSAVTDLGATGLQAFGVRLNCFQAVLDELGVSTAALDGLIAAARKAGAAGAKLTGGGLGGCVVALARDRAVAARVVQAMTTAGAVRMWTVRVGGAGS